MWIRRLTSRLPITAKLTLAYSGAIALVLAAIGVFLYLEFQSGLDTGLNGTLSARADDIARIVAEDGVAGLAPRRDLLSSGDLTAQLLDRSGGKVLFASSGGAAAPMLDAKATRRANGTARYLDRHEHDRFLVRRAGNGGQIVVVRASLRQRERALELLNVALLGGGGLMLLVAAFGGYALAAAVLRPMEGMRRAAADISDVDPQARLPLPAAEDEVYRLGVTLNDMLGRLEHARDRERTFVADASHELRTPLAILRTEVEVALRTDNPPETLRAALGVVGEEAARLSQLAEDLLVIARSDAGRMDLDRRRVPARQLLDDIDRRFRVRAREGRRPVTVAAEPELSVVVDVPRVEQALSNLVDNALRHGAGTITLSAVADDGHVELHVLDQGDGLPAPFLPRAFERFSRAQAGRTGQGSGLGLAIAEIIAAAHGGRAGIANRADGPGADAWLRLPA